MVIDIWKPAILGEQVDLLTGFPFKSAEYTEDIAGIRLVRGDNVVQGMFRWNDVKRWPREKIETSSDYFLNLGDVVLAMDRPWIEAGLKYACVSEHDIPCLLVQRVSRLRARPTLDQTFLRYVIGSSEFTNYILNIQTGTAVPHISSDQIKAYQFLLPPLLEQRVIAKILSALDRKIGVNRRMNATLESMTQAFFKSWFIDFDPVRAKTDGNHPIGMDTDTARLFPSSFDEDIPKGWKVVQFGDFLSPSRDRIGIEDAPEYSATVDGLSLRDKNFNKTLSRSKDKNKKIVKNNLVFGLSRQTLNFGVMKEDIGSVSPIYEIFNIDTSVYIPELLEMFIRLRMDSHVDILKPAAREGQAIDRNYLFAKKILVPDMKVQICYQEFCSAFRNQIAHNEKESRTLGSLRDSLLPKLMRGEVRVNEN